MLVVFSLDLGQISFHLIKNAFATQQLSFLATGIAFYNISTRGCAEMKFLDKKETYVFRLFDFWNFFFRLSMDLNFMEHLYVPKKSPGTEEFFHEKEDHNHVPKWTTCAKEGCIPSIGLQYFRDTLHDDKTGLMYEALTDKWKQSVPDCEKFCAVGVLKFMEDSRHETDAKVLKTVLN